jgi:RDD family protein
LAVYDPPQPLWKRNLAAILDFLLSFSASGYIFSKVFGPQPGPKVQIPGATTTEMFGIGGLPLLCAVIAVILYFVVLGRTGGTIFQRLFGMKRAARA